MSDLEPINKSYSPRAEYLKLIEGYVPAARVADVAAWMMDPDRLPALHAFTEGPSRQLAYAFEAALRMESETTKLPPTGPMKTGARCSRCGHVEFSDA